MFLKTTVFILLALLLTAILTSCGKIPADPGKTYSKAVGTALVAGFVPSPPWVVEQDSSAGGVEGELIKGFARENGMKIIWHTGSEQQLMKKLEDKELHVLIAGLTKDTPWRSEKIGITNSYFREEEKRGKQGKHVIAVLQGENRLVMNLEKYLFDKRDMINKLLNETDKEF